jgi:hypothetical protein
METSHQIYQSRLQNTNTGTYFLTPNVSPSPNYRPGCGHLAVVHNGHTDILMEGMLYHFHKEGSVITTHSLEDSIEFPTTCDPNKHTCLGHSPEHIHGPGCGHESVTHKEHVDYLVDNLLHHYHDGHCDIHGSLPVLSFDERSSRLNENSSESSAPLFSSTSLNNHNSSSNSNSHPSTPFYWDDVVNCCCDGNEAVT